MRSFSVARAWRPTVDLPLSSNVRPQNTKMSDEHFYARVADELRRGGPISGLWAKAFAECNGDDSRSKALYLRLRVQQLKQAERAARKAEEAAQQASEQEQIVRQRREEAEAEERLEHDRKVENAARPFYKRTISGDVASFIVVLGFMLLLLSAFFLFSG
jgi:hypothetical protein